MANRFQILKKVILLLLVFIFFVKPINASSVTVGGYTPLLSNWSNLIANNTKISLSSNNLYYKKRVEVKIFVFSNKDHPLSNQRVILSSAQEKDSLIITQPKNPTNKNGEAIAFLESSYNKPLMYNVIALDTTYTEYPIVIKKSINIFYYPNSSTNYNIFGSIDTPGFIIGAINILISVIILGTMLFLFFVRKIRNDSKFKNILRFIRDYLVLYIISAIILALDHTTLNLYIFIFNILLFIIYFIYILL